MPLYFEAVQRTVEAIGDEAFVLAMLRGPLLMASQLCGVEELLIAMLTQPEAVDTVLTFTSAIALRLGKWVLASGAHGLILGEATCSPNFISPKMYREIVHPYHTQLVTQFKAAGWPTVGLHICGNVVPIFDGYLAIWLLTFSFMDIDYQVPADRAITLAQGRVTLRGNLDPSAVFRFGNVDQVRQATAKLVADTVQAPHWIMSSGCDIPPGTPEANLHTFVDTIHQVEG